MKIPTVAVLTAVLAMPSIVAAQHPHFHRAKPMALHRSHHGPAVPLGYHNVWNSYHHSCDTCVDATCHKGFGPRLHCCPGLISAVLCRVHNVLRALFCSHCGSTSGCGTGCDAMVYSHAPEPVPAQPESFRTRPLLPDPFVDDDEVIAPPRIQQDARQRPDLNRAAKQANIREFFAPGTRAPEAGRSTRVAPATAEKEVDVQPVQTRITDFAEPVPSEERVIRASKQHGGATQLPRNPLR